MKFIQSFWRHRFLWWQLTKREVLSRYRGSLLGVGWSLITPLAMLAVYTVVFSQVFKARWGTLEEAGTLGFALNLFAGLIAFNFFSECLNRAPSLMINNPNYVKKVVFPLEVLGYTVVASATFQAAAGVAALVAFKLVATGSLPGAFALLPVIWIPLLLFSLGLCWLVAAVSVYLRDTAQVIPVALNILMFTTPIFFPLSALPQRWQSVVSLNPLAGLIEQIRNVTITGVHPPIAYLGVAIGGTLLFCEGSYRTFKKLSKGFADTL